MRSLLFQSLGTDGHLLLLSCGHGLDDLEEGQGRRTHILRTGSLQAHLQTLPWGQAPASQEDKGVSHGTRARSAKLVGLGWPEFVAAQHNTSILVSGLWVTHFHFIKPKKKTLQPFKKKSDLIGQSLLIRRIPRGHKKRLPLLLSPAHAS